MEQMFQFYQPYAIAMFVLTVLLCENYYYLLQTSCCMSRVESLIYRVTLQRLAQLHAECLYFKQLDDAT